MIGTQEGHKVKLDTLLEKVAEDVDTIALSKSVKELEVKVEDSKKQLTMQYVSFSLSILGSQLTSKLQNQ